MLQVRDARPGEHARVGELTVAAYLADSVVPASSPYLAELRDARRRAELAELLVAESADGRLAGTVTWCVAGTPYAEVSRSGEAEFRMLAVDPGARGLGVGAALVAACIARTRAAGATALVLCTARLDGPAVRLYERLGFRREPDRDWEPVPDLPLYGYALGPLLPERYCDACGSPVGTAGHEACAARRELEPPRFCAACGRRMSVQVTPLGWAARCSRHGDRTSGPTR